MNILLSSSYWPNLHYFYYVLNAEKISIEQCDNYQKQSFRNRTQILSANGKLDLSIPIKKMAPKQTLKDVEICYEESWQNNHWRAITSAYKNSPYFEFFEEEIRAFYERQYAHLLEYNTLQLHFILKALRCEKPISFTTEYRLSAVDSNDFRQVIHPKIDFETDALAKTNLNREYYQTFQAKFAFVPNLSILDLLFNVGLKSKDYLLQN